MHLSILGCNESASRLSQSRCNYKSVEDVSKLARHRGRILTPDIEREALLAGAEKDRTLDLFVLIALTTACCAGELQELTWADADVKSGRLLFRETKNATPDTPWVHGQTLWRPKAHNKVHNMEIDRAFVNPSVRGQRC